MCGRFSSQLKSSRITNAAVHSSFSDSLFVFFFVSFSINLRVWPCWFINHIIIHSIPKHNHNTTTEFWHRSIVLTKSWNALHVSRYACHVTYNYSYKYLYLAYTVHIVTHCHYRYSVAECIYSCCLCLVS